MIRETAGMAMGAIALLWAVAAGSNIDDTIPRRIALLELERENVTALEGSIVAHFIRNALVNARRWEVLDRDHMDKILREQSMKGYGLIDADRAVEVGKVLNVEDILVGSLMKLHGVYFVEIRMIDVRTSSIRRSQTARCSTSQELANMAERVVHKMKTGHGAAPGPDSAGAAPLSATPSYESWRAVSRGNPVHHERSAEMLHWKTAGLSYERYRGYLRSGQPLDRWIARQHRSALIAGLIGPATCTSGFFYTHDWAAGLLTTFVKAIGVVGMIRAQPQGEETGKFWTFAGVLGAATLSDAAAAAITASARNARLDRLIGESQSAASKGRTQRWHVQYCKAF